MTDPTAASPPPDAVPAGRVNALASSSGRPAAQLTAAPVAPALPPHVADAPANPSVPHRVWPWILLLVVVAGGYALYRQLNKPAPAAADASAAGKGRGGGAGTRPVSVLASAARRADVPVYLDGLLGSVTALNTVTVHSRVDGQLESVSFHEGDFVHKGDVLAEIDPRPFQAQLEQAQGQQAKDQAQLENAKVDLKRYQALFAQDSVAKQQLDTQQATVNQDEAVLTSDQAQIDTARLNVTYAHITAPLTGRIGLRLVDAGNIVHASDQNGLLVITQVQPIAVVFPIPEDSLPRVVPKVRAGNHLKVDAFDRDPAKPTLLDSGTVLSLDNEVDPATASVKVKAVFQNAHDALFPNQFVNVRVLIDTLSKVTVVPSAAVQRGPQATYVFVVKPDDTVDMRTITVQLTEGDDTVVSKGVNVGEMVVTDGLDKLQPGAHVQVRSGAAPAAAPAAATPGVPATGGRKGGQP